MPCYCVYRYQTMDILRSQTNTRNAPESVDGDAWCRYICVYIYEYIPYICTRTFNLPSFPASNISNPSMASRGVTISPSARSDVRGDRSEKRMTKLKPGKRNYSWSSVFKLPKRALRKILVKQKYSLERHFSELSKPEILFDQNAKKKGSAFLLVKSKYFLKFIYMFIYVH